MGVCPPFPPLDAPIYSEGLASTYMPFLHASKIACRGDFVQVQVLAGAIGLGTGPGPHTICTVKGQEPQ